MQLLIVRSLIAFAIGCLLAMIFISPAHATGAGKGHGGPSAPSAQIAVVTPEGLFIRESQVKRSADTFTCVVIAGKAKGKTYDCRDYRTQVVNTPNVKSPTVFGRGNRS